MESFIEKNRKKDNKSEINAIILAAGVGLRLVPINNKVPKAMLCVNGKPLIERQIEHLHEVGIKDICIVVGFKKELFFYLIEKYGVKLVNNDCFVEKNNLHSLSLVVEYINNTYIIPSDIWCRKNPFKHQEDASWYMVSNRVDNESCVRIDSNDNLNVVSPKIGGNAMLGICYLDYKDSNITRERIGNMSNLAAYDNAFWEKVLYNGNVINIKGKPVSCADYVEINTYEQLRELDSSSEQLKSNAIKLICNTFDVNEYEITDINVLKKGMTNKSFLFSCKKNKYIMRIPGEGTDQLVNRAHEAYIYSAIMEKDICDDVVYINSKNGYKITRFISDSRPCNPYDINDVKLCMQKLKEFHSLELSVNHYFDIFEQIEFYESLWDGNKSCYKDYEKTKAMVFKLRKYIDKNKEKYCLSHIDAVPDNFLIYTDNKGSNNVRLIDWEYAGMQDPHIDIAMFCIYSLYNKRQIDRTINIYFENKCPQTTRIKIYCYIAACGLLWSNWCEYKRMLGVEFGEYSLWQYKYAKKYSRILKEEIGVC